MSKTDSLRETVGSDVDDGRDCCLVICDSMYSGRCVPSFMLSVIEETFWKPCRKLLIQKYVTFIQTVHYEAARDHRYINMNLRKTVCVNERNSVFSKLLGRYVSYTWLTRPRKRSLNLNVQNGEGSHERLSLLCGKILPCWYVAFWFCIVLVSERSVWNKPVVYVSKRRKDGWVGGCTGIYVY
jgi:hypothetical protein